MSSGWVTKTEKIIKYIGDCTLKDCTLCRHGKPSEFAIKEMAIIKLSNLEQNFNFLSFSQAMNQIKVTGKNLPQNILCPTFT